MSMSTFRAFDLEGKPMTVKPPRYAKGRLVPQHPDMRPEMPYRYIPKSDDAWQAKAINIFWSGVYKKRKTGRPIYERRIRAVRWGRDEEVYNTRKDGRRGAWRFTQFVVDFEFPLPNWDWQPEMTEEHEQLARAA
jgi:hypothetical protein